MPTPDSPRSVTVLEATPQPERTVCRAARNDYLDRWVGDLSYSEAMAGIDGDTLDEKTTTLIEHLLAKGHFGPFEHVSMTLAIEGVSRSLMAQLTRHRHATFDVQSQRYVDFSGSEPGDLVVTPQTVADITAGGRNPHGTSRSDVRDQTGLDDAAIERARQEVFARSVARSVADYNDLLALGVPPEDARFVLPVGSRVNIVVTLNARMLLHVFDMRGGAEAQWEIRGLTDRVVECAREWMPATVDYYEREMEHRKNKLAP